MNHPCSPAKTTVSHEDNKREIFKELRFRSGLTVKNRLFRSNVSGTFDDYNGHGAHTRINWEEKFARGGVGAIISSFVPVTPQGRIMVRYAMIDDDDKIRFWKEVGDRVHQHNDCKFILQLSHSGRQQDMGGVENLYRLPLSSTNESDFFHGLLCQAMSLDDIKRTVELFAKGARRAQRAGLDGVELHGANGYLLTQFLSSAINDRTDDYGGPVANRARFVLDIVRAIRGETNGHFHLQMKINAVDADDWLWPFTFRARKLGNTLADTIEICKILEDKGNGVDAFHISSGSTFPHPRNPPGDFPVLAAQRWYDIMLNQGIRTRMNYWVFGNSVAGRLFRRWWLWRRGPVVQGINAEYAREIKKAVSVPVLCTGGFQYASHIAELLRGSYCDGVTMARPLIRNNDLPRILERQDGPALGKECTYCNRCLLNVLENPLGCYELDRYDGNTFDDKYENMIKSVMSVYEPPTYEKGSAP